ncbi:Uncharacterised protein [uncultured archaeon]|nr:Uncharacterised protein [uncultured archaeon]
MGISKHELAAKAKEINDLIFGVDRKMPRKAMDALKQQADESARYALQKAFSMKGVPESEKRAFIEVLKEKPDAINILMVAKEDQQKSVEMIRPIFGARSSIIIGTFRHAYEQLQEAIREDRERYKAG